MKDIQEKLLDKKTVQERYHFKKWALEWLIRTRQISGMVRIGRRRIYFDPVELEAWIEKNRIGRQKFREDNRRTR